MHCYRKTKEEEAWLYTVGYWTHEDEWIPLEDTSDESEARALVNYLNGGMGYLFRYTTEK